MDSGDSGRGLRVDVNTVHDWLLSAQAGSKLIYFQGDLAFEREKTKRAETISVADRLYAASIAKRVCLTQKRLGDFTFQYIATKRRQTTEKNHGR